MTQLPPSLSCGIDPSRPTTARVYDALLGGKDNFAVDREFVRELLPANPHLPQLVRDNREFLKRAVTFLVRQGIRQFLDIGTGLPTSENVHQVAQRVVPECRIVYVDNDPSVLAHARALLTSTPQGSTAYIDSDARDTEKILGQAAKAGIDFSEPVAVLFVAILHFLQDAESVTAALRDALPPGSHMVITHAVDRPDFEAVAARYQQSMNTGTLRTPDQITGLFGDWELVAPGLVALPDWRPEDQPADRSAAGLFLGGVAHSPGSPEGSR